MSIEKVLKHDKQIPRYTSYPTAPHFSSTIDSQIYTSWLKSLTTQDSLSLYFHIPFCQKMCWYCGCYTKVTQRYAPIANYTDLLIKEIKLISNILGGKKPPVLHIHFGGGSPTILLGQDFAHLITTIKSEFNVDANAEITIEVDPRNVDEEKIKSYAESGINRVSIGVQDFDDQVQKAINREQSFELVDNVIKFFRKYGIRNVNLDLIYGLPKQTIEIIAKNIDYALLLNPDRLAIFSYAHVPWMKKHIRLIDENDLPDSLTKILMYQTASQKLIAHNYQAIGLDHFAKPKDSMSIAFKTKKLKRNFQGYSTDQANNIIGFGVSAISHLTSGYAQNTLDFNQYQQHISNQTLPIAKGIATNQDDRIRKTIIDEIMCYMEGDLNSISNLFALPNNFFDDEIKSLKGLEEDGLIKIENNLIKINPDFPQVSRIVSSHFDKFFQPQATRHSKVI